MTISIGEGSRGGHVIGHTRSGKPIYGNSRSRDEVSALGKSLGYTSSDHRDAMWAQQSAREKALRNMEGTQARVHIDLEAHHRALEYQMRTHGQ